MPARLLRHRFTVDEYYRMAEAGIFSEDDRVELIEGEILEMAGIGSPHAACVDRLNRLFTSRLEDAVIVRVQNPMRLDRYSEPQPDLTLLRPRADFYASGHPGSGDVLLAVEVADTTEEFDREVRAPLYARAGIPEMWVVLLEHDAVDVYRHPSAGRYEDVRQIRRGETLSLLGFPHFRAVLEDVLG